VQSLITAGLQARMMPIARMAIPQKPAIGAIEILLARVDKESLVSS
jgi:hypothetical protein